MAECYIDAHVSLQQLLAINKHDKTIMVQLLYFRF